MATFTKLKSGSWRAHVRRKRKQIDDTFLRRKDAEEWSLEVERRIDRGEPSTARSSSTISGHFALDYSPLPYGAFGPVLKYQSAICSPVQNSTSFFFRISSKILRKYFARCGAPMM